MESANDDRGILFTLIHADDRVFIRKPLTFDDALEQASAEFPHLIKESIVFKTKEHPECKGHLQKIAACAWDLVVADITCAYVEGKRRDADGKIMNSPAVTTSTTTRAGASPTASRTNGTPGRTTTTATATTPSRTRPSLGNPTESSASRTRAVSRPSLPNNNAAAGTSGNNNLNAPVRATSLSHGNNAPTTKRKPIPLPSVTSTEEFGE